MNQWMKAAAAGCCLIMLSAVAGCSGQGQNINGPKTPAMTKSFMGGPMPANSPWAKRLGSVENAGNAVPKPHPVAAPSADAAPHAL